MENSNKIKGGKKGESASTEDLKNIIKQMIKKALDDNDHMLKLHKKVCEEWSSFLEYKPPNIPTKYPPPKKKSPMTINVRKKMEKCEPMGGSTSNPSKTKKIMQRTPENRPKIQKLLKQEENAQKMKEEENNAQLRRERAWEFYHQQKRVQKGWKMRKNWELNSWFNQLDSVLHQKYLREHRHRVQSFYCQPTYYGTDIPGALYQQYGQCEFTH